MKVKKTVSIFLKQIYYGFQSLWQEWLIAQHSSPIQIFRRNL